jgi:hypothetical protein
MYRLLPIPFGVICIQFGQGLSGLEPALAHKISQVAGAPAPASKFGLDILITA